MSTNGISKVKNRRRSVAGRNKRIPPRVAKDTECEISCWTAVTKDSGLETATTSADVTTRKAVNSNSSRRPFQPVSAVNCITESLDEGMKVHECSMGEDMSSQQSSSVRIEGNVSGPNSSNRCSQVSGESLESDENDEAFNNAILESIMERNDGAFAPFDQMMNDLTEAAEAFGSPTTNTEADILFQQAQRTGQPTDPDDTNTELIVGPAAQQPRTGAKSAQSLRRDRRKQVGLYDNAEYDEEAITPYYIGAMDQVCRHCNALMFEVERDSKSGDFLLCCSLGKVGKQYLRFNCSPGIRGLLEDVTHPDYKHFHRYIRQYNSALSLVSTGAEIRDEVNGPGQPWIFRIHGTVMHSTASTYRPGTSASYNQVYYYDPREALAHRSGQPYNVDKLDERILETLDHEFRENNCFVRCYMNVREVEQTILRRNPRAEIPNLCLLFHMRPTTDQNRWNAPTSDEVSAVYTAAPDGSILRDMAVYMRKPFGTGSDYVRVKPLSPYLESMSYILFYPYGSLGWCRGMLGANDRGVGKRQNISQREYYAAKMFQREGEFNPILLGGRLFQQWLVDVRMLTEQEKLMYHVQNEATLLVESYMGVHDWLNRTAADLNLAPGKVTICPSKVTGSERWYGENYRDAMALVRKLGRPDIFITITCNPKWLEITENLLPGQTYADRPDLVARVFMIRSKQMVAEITEGNCFGLVQAWCYTVEFQKRGLPHIHLAVILDANHKITQAYQMDRIVCAEIPDPMTEPRLYKLISESMIHGPCFIQASTRSCRQKNENKCSKFYPQPLCEATSVANLGYAMYKRNSGRKVGIFSKGERVEVGDEWVVAHNKKFCVRHDCHVNVEACNSVKSVKYLYKYIYKGGDRADMLVKKNSSVDCNEIKAYLDGKFLSPPQAAWELFLGETQKKSHSVIRLTCNLPNQFNIRFKPGEERVAYEAASKKCRQLPAFFQLCSSCSFAKTLLYEEVPEYYSFVAQKGIWKPKVTYNKWTGKVIGRIFNVGVRDVERYYLRLLLLHVRGPTSYSNLRTVDGVMYASFREAAAAAGLVKDDEEWMKCMTEAMQYQMPRELRSLFGYLLVFNTPGNALQLWEKFCRPMAEDFMDLSIFPVSEERAVNLALLEIECFLKSHRMSVADFGIDLPEQDSMRNEDYMDSSSLAAEGTSLYHSLNPDQKNVFDAVWQAVSDSSVNERCFFIDGPGGSGKTHTYRAIQAHMEASGKKVIAMATTGIAADLLHGGRTMHSAMKMPLQIDVETIVTIVYGSYAYFQLREADLFIIDEASMMKAEQLEYMSAALKYVTGDVREFGGKVVVLGGDFRQTLPIVRSGSVFGSLGVILKKSKLWHLFKTIHLKQNMRAGPYGAFCQWLLKVGDGVVPTPMVEYPGYIDIPAEYLCGPDDLMEKVYGESLRLADTSQFAESIVVTPTNKLAWDINASALEKLPGNAKVYYSEDSIFQPEGDVNSDQYCVEDLNLQTTSGLPFHKLVLKKNAVIMVLRNLHNKSGLLNGTRCIVEELHHHLIKARILSGSKAGNVVFIPRIDCRDEDSKLPYILQRRQFPVALSFAMTINKSQGQSFQRVGVYLPSPVFSHGQLYVALSRCRNPNSLFVSITHDYPHWKLANSQMSITLNVVWQSALSHSVPLESTVPAPTASSDDAMEVDEIEISRLFDGLSVDETFMEMMSSRCV